MKSLLALSSRRRFRALLFSLPLLLWCLAALFGFQLIQTVTVTALPFEENDESSSSSAPPSDAKAMLSTSAPTTSKILESLWETFKQTLESSVVTTGVTTTSAASSSSTGPGVSSSSSSSTKLESSSSSSSSSRAERETTGEISYHRGQNTRRKLLLEHALQEHYTLNLIAKSSPHLDGYGHGFEQDPQHNKTNNDNNNASHHPFPQKQQASALDAQEINQTMHRIHQVMHNYLHQSEADHYKKSHPDRTTSLHIGLPPVPPSRVKANLKLIREMFTHAYDGYMYHAYPAAEVKPITCEPAVFDLVRLPALTLVDSLDTLVVLGNYTEFARSVERLKLLHKHMAKENKIADKGMGGIFALNQNVSVFETNIRVLGGLLSAHQLAQAFLTDKVRKANVFSAEGGVLLGTSGPQPETTTTCTSSSSSSSMHVSEECSASSSLQEECNANKKKAPKCQNNTAANDHWVYDGFLLELAQDIGSRLLPAFETRTGIPYGTVNLLSGIPKGETTIASLAGGGTLTLEMELLSRLTGDPSYGQAAKLSARALWMRRSSLNLFGKHVCTHRGEWTESLSGIGSNSDSFLEYLIKHHILFPEDQDFWLQMFAAYGGVHNESRLGEWYADVDMSHGTSKGSSRQVFESLMAFYPGMQVLLGELTPAARSLNSFFLVREFLGFLPERFHYGYWKVDGLGGKHYLRPELLESAYFMHRATKGINQQFQSNSSAPIDSSGWQWAADFSLHAIEKQTRTTCGYASLKDLSTKTTGTLRNPPRGRIGKLMNEMPSFFLSETLKYLYLTFDEDNILHTDDEREWIFTTEAHPIHYAPPQEHHNRAARLKALKDSVKDRLRRRVQGKHGKLSSPWKVLNEEKWTDTSQLRHYVKVMEPVILQVGGAHLARIRNRMIAEDDTHSIMTASSLVEPFLSSDQIYVEYDFFGETLTGGNLAHLSFKKLGQGYLLTKACPNYYASDLLWIRALNGGATDYADTYISTVQDEVGESNSRFYMLGAADALAIHGSGLYVAQVFGTSQNCPVREEPKETSGVTKQGRGQGQEGKDRFDLGEDLGSFDVSAFPGGSGFFIQRVESGETVITTLIDDGTTNEAFMMVYASPGTSADESDQEQSSKNWRLSNSRLASMFKVRNKEPGIVGTLSDRSVVMADLKGNVYVCQIEIIRIKNGAKQESSNDDDSTSEEDDAKLILARYPCAPALFGPTHISRLVATDGLVVEAVIRPPVTGDEYGCMKVDSDDAQVDFMPRILEKDERVPSLVNQDLTDGENNNKMELRDDDVDDDDDGQGSCQNKVVQLLHRGVCTFQEKAMNQKNNFNAEAVIMINSEEEELFVMSGGAEDNQVAEQDIYPATVLVTGADGDEMLHLIQIATPDDGSAANLLVRVSLIRQDTKLEETGGLFSISGNKFWPAIRASSDSLQIFAKGGWGVHAVQRGGNPNVEWQLYLLRHQT
jgi:mannosidase alpha-like ER degradation enhancer 2